MADFFTTGSGRAADSRKAPRPKDRMHAGRVLAGAALLALAGCGQQLDFDLRGLAGGFNTADAARQASAARPQPDSRGVISYPNYQVAIARRGDRLADVAARIGLPPQQLASFNGLSADAPLREGEVLVLPQRVQEPAGGPLQPGAVDITSLAGNAIERAGAARQPEPAPAAPPPSGTEPIRHKVEPGETAYSIARLYNVSVRALAEWNGLGPDLSVRAGQYLLIPVAAEPAPPAAAEPPESAPDTPLPPPPSAASALPGEDDAHAPSPPPAPDLGAERSATSEEGGFIMPVQGQVIRPYVPGRNDGIGIAAPAGSPVLAARDGTVAAITRDTSQVPIIILRHDDNYLTVYAGVDALTVQKGDSVTRGQQIATVRVGNPSFLHFEIRRGLESVDPVPLLN